MLFNRQFLRSMASGLPAAGSPTCSASAAAAGLGHDRRGLAVSLIALKFVFAGMIALLLLGDLVGCRAARQVARDQKRH
jgi:hypothetical protein